MSRVLVLHEDEVIRAQLSSILKAEGYEVVERASTEEAKQDNTAYDLYVCGQLGKYSDGLLYAAECAMAGHNVLIVSERRKFSKIPFLDTSLITNKKAVIQGVKNALAGD